MFWISSLIAKFIFWIIKTLKLGNGYTWPGHIINKLFPKIWESPLLKYKKGLILISGTNGKTTTSKLITHMLVHSGNSVTTNKSGANLSNGVLTSILLDTNFWGQLDKDYGVFEVDELHLPLVLEHMHSDFVILTNLSRDQLDRYGEVDTVVSRWVNAFTKLGDSLGDSSLVVSADFAYRDTLAASFGGDVVTFDSSNELNSHHLLDLTPLVGRFNRLNLNAALTVVKKLGVGVETIESSLSSFEPAFGRGESLTWNNRTFLVFLAKNPASFNSNLKMLQAEVDLSNSREAVLFILNDNIPDGRDVSWIYDIDPKLLHSFCQRKSIYVGGTRSLDMQIRLNYAGIPKISNLGPLDSSFLDRLVNLHESSFLVLPNYSAMLEFRKLVTGKNIL